jgi:AcrR family transcriptional regulator
MPPKPNLRPRTKPPAQRRDELMNAAERLFLEKGFERVSIEEITQGADVAKGTFYLQFSSKVDVLEALRTRFAQRLLDGVAAEVAKQRAEDWSGRLEAWARACAIGYLDAARLHDLVFIDTPPASRKGLASNVLVDHLTKLLADGARRNAWSIDDPNFTAVFLFNALHGVVNQGADSRTASDRAKLLRAIEHHCLRSVGASRKRGIAAGSARVPMNP